MTLPVWQGLAAQESSGDIVVLASPTVTVTDKATGAQPSLFSDRAGNSALGNPFTAGADGSIEFYVAPGRYKVEATKGGQTVTWDNQLIGTVHGAEHLWKLATVEIITVAGNASSPTDDAYSADLGGNLSADDTFIGRVANRNETTTPTFENTGGTPGALTITAYDGRPLWPGALEGDHRFQYEAGTSPETWLVLDPNDMGVVDPEHATDSATDTYVSATNTTPPADGVKITRDFQSANTTTTPTLDGKTMTTRDGSALWAGAVSGPHELQYASGTDTYLVLEPLPIDEDDMASDSAAAVPTQQSVKAYADTKARIATGTYTGDGTTSQGITGVGFQPEYVRIHIRETATNTEANIYETTDQIIDDNANGLAIQIQENAGAPVIVTRDNSIISLDSDGFTVDDSGVDSHPNKNTQVYNYMAIG